MNTRTLMTLTATAAATVLALSGCSAPGATDDSNDKLRVVATTTQLGDFVDEVGGDDVELVTLLSAGASAHHFDPSPKQLLEIGRADVLVENGAGLEEFIESTIEASGFDGATITAAVGIDLDEAAAITAEFGGDDHDHDHGDEHDEAHDEDHDHDHDHEHDEAHEEEHDHDHDHDTGLNPHLWTSPGYAQGMVDQLADGLAAADPRHADDYRARADAYGAQLEALDAWIASQYAQVPEAERLFVSGHNAMTYYLHDYGIHYVGSLLPSFDDNAEPSAAQIDELIHEIEEHGVRAIFTESSISPKLAETVAAQTGAVWVSGEDALYVDSLGVEGSGAETYIAATVHNTTTILEAWGYEVQAPPEELDAN